MELLDQYGFACAPEHMQPNDDPAGYVGCGLRCERSDHLQHDVCCWLSQTQGIPATRAADSRARTIRSVGSGFNIARMSDGSNRYFEKRMGASWTGWQARADVARKQRETT